MSTYHFYKMENPARIKDTVYHLNNFDSVMKSTIVLNLNEWIENSFGRTITIFNHSELLTLIDHNLISKIYDYGCGLPDLYIGNELKEREIIQLYNNGKISMECKTILIGILNIKMNDKFINTIFESMYNLYNQYIYKLKQTEKEKIFNMTDYLFSNIILFLLEGYRLWYDFTADFRPANDYEYLLSWSHIHTITDELIDSIELGKLKTVKFLLYYLYDKILGLDTTKYALPFFIFMDSKNFNVSKIIDDIKEIQNNYKDTFDIIKELDVTPQCIDSLSYGFKVSKNRNESKLIKNYDNTTISEEKNKCLIFGGNILDDNINKAISSVKDLASEVLDKYHNTGLECCFELTESQMGCIRYEFNYNELCIIKDKNNIYNIIQISNVNYLLYRLFNNKSPDNNIYGMSFDINKDDEGEYRNLITIKYDNNKIYKLVDGDDKK